MTAKLLICLFVCVALGPMAGASQATGPWPRLGLWDRLPPSEKQLGQAEEAAEETDDWWLGWELVGLYARAGRADDARSELDRCRELEEGEPGMVSHAEAQIALAEGDLTAAAGLLQEALGRARRSGYAWAIWRDIGDLALMATQDSAAATQAFETALLLAFTAPGSWRSWDELATDIARLSPAAERPLWLTTASALACAEGRGREEQATLRRQMAQSLEAVSALYPPRAAPLVAASYLDRWLGSPEEAKEALRAAIAADPGCLAAHLDLAGLLLQGGQAAEAQAEYAQVVQLAGPLADVAGEAHLHLSRIGANAGEWEAALQHYCIAWLNLEQGVDAWEPARLAYLALKAGDPARGLAVLQGHDRDLRSAGYDREVGTLEGVAATLQGALGDYAAMEATASAIAEHCAAADRGGARLRGAMCGEVAAMGDEAGALCLKALFVRSGDAATDAESRAEWLQQALKVAPAAPLPKILLAMELLRSDKQRATGLLREAQAALPANGVLWTWCQGLLR